MCFSVEHNLYYLKTTSGISGTCANLYLKLKSQNKSFKNDYIIIGVLWTRHEGEKYEWFWNSDFSKSQSTLKPFTSP